MSITSMLNRDKVARKIKIIALLSHPWRIILGGLFAAIGVLGMHYLGMMGQRTHAVMTFHAGVVAASCIIAWVTAIAAFWIIFRVLTFWPYYNSLRVGSALVMGLAICGTHYTGMVAASYEYTEEDHIASTAFLINGTAAFLTATHGSVLVCFWMLSLSVVTDLRVDALSARSQNITGAAGAIQVMEQWRSQENKWKKLLLLGLSSLALGGCGIWSMHFTGMNALRIELNDSTMLEVNFEGGITILSFVFAVLGVFVGLKIASTDPFFLEIEHSRRKELLSKDLKKMKMENVVKKSQIGKQIKFIALFSRLWHIIAGGFFAALGVLGMHYLGMLAQRTNADIHMNPGIIALSVVIAFFTANAAFWILFRALTFWPNNEALRMGSALIMGVAVCGTHYSGMGAATYTYSEENYADRTAFLLKGASASTIASHGSLLLCFWLSTFAVVVSLRKEALSSISSKNHTTLNPNTEKSQGPRPPIKSKAGHSSRQSEQVGINGPNVSFVSSQHRPPMIKSMKSFKAVMPMNIPETNGSSNGPSLS
ncbi:hypothetical protein Poli38472_010561 [Pythium oligandrum]|uniref:MHYT domain-containing protein n=1 Tax=Pythium oligandrum TaxID=41045 RepID=A0A8K1FCC0_PYTOL|nr:hypothetical protein Poli38472_010561 [Pythium oligandrum]|eukprot:TMW55679.1 hypothetical protein Poli38472_010561 [Pythium oligandrum]